METAEAPTRPKGNPTIAGTLRRKLEPRLQPEQLELVDSALEWSASAHEGQSRANGQPYIIHPLSVADVLADWEMDCQSIIAALLHDVVEDTPVTLAQIEQKFGHGVASLVDGVSKIEKLENQRLEERQAENFRKILLAISKDWRVIFIKLGDRLHNIRTLASISDAARRKRIARETLDIYAPIAERLGMSVVSRQLEDLAFRHLHPHRYRVLSKALQNSGKRRRKAIEDAEETIVGKLREHGVDAAVTGRQKNVYSIHKKMSAKKLSFLDVDDIVGVRVVVLDRLECYRALGVLHMCFKPIPTKFDDYIAVPKSNGYQSLHTTVKDGTGLTLEMQIRTEQMHAFAEQGLAAHWLYKQGGENVNEAVQTVANRQLQGLMKLHSETNDSTEFLENVKVELYPEEIYVMSPKGDIYTMPPNSTALDFAYLIHSDVGNSASFVRINGKPMPLSTKLKTGNVIAVEQGARSDPLPHWLNFVTTARARSQIRNRLRQEKAHQTALLGKQFLVSSFNKMGSDLQDMSEERWKVFFTGKPFGTMDELYREIGLGKVSADLTAYELLGAGEQKRARPRRKAPPILVGGGGSPAAMKLAECCHPLPGEPIVGMLRKGRGIKVHQHACPQLQEARGSVIWIDVAWDPNAANGLYLAPIAVECRNKPGISSRIFTAIAEEHVNIEGFSMRGGATQHNQVSIHIIVEVHSLQQYESLMRKLRADTMVYEARRSGEIPA